MCNVSRWSLKRLSSDFAIAFRIWSDYHEAPDNLGAAQENIHNSQGTYFRILHGKCPRRYLTTTGV
jgi:hypothetical protein